MEEKFNKIMKRLKEHWQELEKRGFEIVALMLQGSQNYLLDEYSDKYMSDIDSKAIVLPKFDDFVRNKTPYSSTIILDNEEHIDVKDIRIMEQMWRKENISYIELLYTDYYIVNPKYAADFTLMRENRDKMVMSDPRRFVSCLVGMGYEKRKALCHPYPGIIDKIEKYGFDGKQLSHMLRLNFFLDDFLNGKPISDCYKITDKLRRIYLMNLKKNLILTGEMPMSKEEAIRLADSIVEELEKLKLMSDSFTPVEVPEMRTAAILKQWFKEELL